MEMNNMGNFVCFLYKAAHPSSACVQPFSTTATTHHHLLHTRRGSKFRQKVQGKSIMRLLPWARRVPPLVALRISARPFHQSARCSRYGEWVKGGRPLAEEEQAQGINVFGGYAGDYDTHRPSYPKQMWDDVQRDVQNGDAPNLRSWVSLDVAAGTGRGALELARRGFNSTALDLDVGMLAEVEAKGAAEGLAVRTVHGPAEKTGVPDHTVDLVVTLQAFHWFDAQLALEEFYRVLKPDGVFVVGYNDRDLSVPWMAQLEDLLERYNTKYNRKLRLTEEWTRNGKLLTETGLFELSHVQTYPNPKAGMTGEGLVQLLRTMSYVRNALDVEELGRFEAEVRDLVRRHHGDQPFVHPFLCKKYTLRPLPKSL